MQKPNQQHPSKNEFIDALNNESLVLTGYGIHAHLSPLDIQDFYAKYQQSQQPLRKYAQLILRSRGA